MREASVLPCRWERRAFLKRSAGETLRLSTMGRSRAVPGKSLAPGQDFTAVIGDQQCGVGKVLPAEENAKTKDLRYVIKVVATESGAAQACGVPEKDVTFKFGDTSPTRRSSGKTALRKTTT